MESGTDDQERDPDEFLAALDLANRAFSPSSPITERQLFAGRTEQMNRLFDVIASRGQHALIYGDRGVGKTSLAKVVSHAVEGITAFYTCNSSDTYADIWPAVFDEIQWVAEALGPGFTPRITQTLHTATEMLGGREPTPDDIRRVLGTIASVAEVCIFIDEFDRPQDPTTRRLMADTIKILSDHGIQATLVLIGVAEAVSELIAEHQSIGRALAQVQMPLMSPAELALIVTTGMENAELRVESGFVDRVVQLSQGLPHFTHLISQHAARIAVEGNRRTVLAGDSTEAVSRSLADVSQTIREAYHRATYSNRDNLYRDVLLACAMAHKNAVGQFDSRAVAGALLDLTGKAYEIPAFSGHLSAFSDPEGPRGGILQKLGTRARYDYRFLDPLMPPYTMMQGHADGVL